MPKTCWMRCQWALQAVGTGAQVRGPRICENFISGWNVFPPSSLVPTLKSSRNASAQA